MEAHVWHKHPSFKNLFESEIGTLQRGLQGDFKLFQLNVPGQVESRVTALGELTFGKKQKQKIQITFPSKYPIAPPEVIACNFDVDKTSNIISQIQPLLFGKGNQYTNGKMCLFEQKFWNKDEHNIGWTLRRAQKWLVSAYSPEGFKKEDIVEELPPFIGHVGQVLIPKDIMPAVESNTGMFYLTQFKPNHYILEHNILQQSTFSLKINIEIFKWYSFDKGVTLKSLFPQLNGDAIVNVFKNYFGVNIIDGEQVKNVAFYLPDEENKWHFFKFIIQHTNIGTKINVQYYVSHILSDELYLRTKDLFDDKILQQKKVTIVGLGAIGSEVAKSLAKNGVGHFNLFDMDTFEIGNSIRHAADLYYIGEKKVDVVKQLILRSNPNITVNTYPIDILNDTGLLENALSKSDLCIVLTAEDSVDYLINDFYIKNFSIPFVFARASIGAFSGAIQVVDSESACLRCLSKDNLDFLPKPKENVRLTEIKPEYGSCSSPALPGSEIDTSEIALQVARISLQCLLINEKSTYPQLLNKQFYWHGPYGSADKESFTWEMKNLRKHKDCKICH